MKTNASCHPTRLALQMVALGFLPLLTVACGSQPPAPAPETASPAADSLTDPAAAGPAATGPAATGPAATGPAATGPAATGPAATGPAAASPAVTSPTADGLAPTSTPPAEGSPAGAKSAAAAGNAALPAGISSASTPAGNSAPPSVPAAEEEVVVLETTKGKVTIALYQQDCPRHCESFKKLVREGFFDELPFFRVFKDGFAQAGSGPDDAACSSPIPAEIKHKHVRGAVGAAHFHNPGTESLPCQFYICTRAQPGFDEDYTVFGAVIEGIEVVDRFQAGNRSQENNGRVASIIADRIVKAAVTAREAAKAGNP